MKLIEKARVLATASALALAGCAGGDSTTPANGITKIKTRGYLSCSGSQGIPGLSRPSTLR